MTTERSHWIDNLRTLTILLVVNMHACVTYTFVGRWYYNAPPEPKISEKIPFFFWQAHLQSFFMGLLFFVAGYYADRSLAKRGTRSFLTERFRRLVIPSLLYMLVLHPLIVYVIIPRGGNQHGLGALYWEFIRSGQVWGASGPMWFALALFLFSTAFAVVRPRLGTASRGPVRLKSWAVIAFGLTVGVASFLVRIVQPMGAAILNFQLCFFAQYVVAFCIGVWVGRRGGLDEMATDPIAKRVGLVALVLGPLALLGILVASLPLPEHADPAITGGLNPLAFSYAIWEQLTGASLALGMMYLCAHKVSGWGQFAAFMSDRSFAVYLFHPPVLVGLALLMQPYRGSVIAMVLVLTVAGLVSSYFVADLARRVPGLRSVL